MLTNSNQFNVQLLSLLNWHLLKGLIREHTVEKMLAIAYDRRLQFYLGGDTRDPCRM
jgi:hypothetical protein